jgi:hypothetical protein
VPLSLTRCSEWQPRERAQLRRGFHHPQLPPRDGESTRAPVAGDSNVASRPSMTTGRRAARPAHQWRRGLIHAPLITCTRARPIRRPDWGSVDAQKTHKRLEHRPRNQAEHREQKGPLSRESSTSWGSLVRAQYRPSNSPAGGQHRLPALANGKRLVKFWSSSRRRPEGRCGLSDGLPRWRLRQRSDGVEHLRAMKSPMVNCRSC